MPETEKLWAVWREDTHGTRFKMREGLSEKDAKAIAAEFEAKGHKQHYWIEPET